MPVVISAPHAVNRFLQGKMKYAEIFTGGITEYLQKQTNCRLICATCSAGLDANDDPAEYCMYKQST